MLRPVYHGENGFTDATRVGAQLSDHQQGFDASDESTEDAVSRLGIPCAGTQVYAARGREEWLSKLPQAGVRRRAELLYQQLDGLQALRREVRPEFLAESRKHYAALLAKGMKPEMARLTLARKIAAITLTLWKKEERFDVEQLKTQAA